MPAHASLTGADLHESKGASSASVDTIPASDGAGSTTWRKVTSASVDATSIKNVNKTKICFVFTDVGTVGSKYIPIPDACTISKVSVAVQAIPSVTNTILTVRNDAGTSMGTLTLTAAEAAGTVHTLSPVSNNTFTAGTKLQFDTDGGATNNPDIIVVLDVTLT